MTAKELAQRMMVEDAGAMPLAFYENFARMLYLARGILAREKATHDQRSHKAAMDATYGPHGQG